MKTLGEGVSDSEIDYMIGMVDVDGDGRIDYKEFASMMMTKIKI